MSPNSKFRSNLFLYFYVYSVNSLFSFASLQQKQRALNHIHTTLLNLHAKFIFLCICTNTDTHHPLGGSQPCSFPNSMFAYWLRLFPVRFTPWLVGKPKPVRTSRVRWSKWSNKEFFKAFLDKCLMKYLVYLNIVNKWSRASEINPSFWC